MSILPSVTEDAAAESAWRLCAALAVNAQLHAAAALVAVCSLPDAQEFCFSQSKGGEDASPLEGLR